MTITASIAIVGWLLAGVLAWCVASWWLWAVTAISAIAALSLTRTRDFPRREVGLRLSPLGSLVLAAGMLLGQSMTRGATFAVLADVERQASIQIAIGSLTGAVCVGWLFRGYGLIPFVSLVGAVWPRRANEAAEVAREYPGALWWFPPVVFLAIGAILVGVVRAIIP